MKLLEIRLDNFRQFYGNQVIRTSHDDARNVTLIRAENGFGKTTLLNALLWCFYEQTTAKFEGKDKLINFDALAEGAKSASVEVLFDHEEGQYLARREVTKNRRNKPLRLFEIKNGSYDELKTPESFINSVVPFGMAKYFFFDGEQAEAFSGEQNNRTVGEAIQTMLGCDIGNTAIDDLEYLSRKFDEDIGKLPGKEEIAREERQLAGLLKAKDRLVVEQRQLLERRDVVGEGLKKLLSELREVHEAADLQRQRDRCEGDLKQATERQADLDRRRARWLADRAAAIASTRLVSTVTSTLERSDLAGIPSPYNEEFVRNLLTKSVCVCGRSLEEGTHEYGCVASLLGNAPSKEIQRKAIQAKAAAAHLHAKRVQDWGAFKDLETDRAANRHTVEGLEQEIGEIREKLKKHALHDVREKETAIQEAQNSEESLSEALGALKVRLSQCESDVEAAKRRIEQLAAGDRAAKPLLERRQLCDAAIAKLRSELDAYKTEARREIAKKINLILQENAHKGFVANISQDFGLSLEFLDGVQTPKSGGENQLLSLAFIAALVRFSFDRQNDDQLHFLVPGTVAPLMLDSPFGQLDPQYQTAVASFVPAMATQVILLVSSAQGSRAVVTALQKRVGREYALVWEDRSKHRSAIEEIEQ